MIYTYDFPLKCAELVKEHILLYTKEFCSKNSYVIDIKDKTNPVWLIINQELNDLLLPEIFNLVIFKRKNHVITTNVHIDSTWDSEDPIHASIIIPIEGYEQTYMYWMNGLYETRVAFTEDKISYKKIIWKGIMKVAHTAEITRPTLCRVDIPHSATSKSDGSYRTILSIRLQDNPTVEEILKKRTFSGQMLF